MLYVPSMRNGVERELAFKPPVDIFEDNETFAATVTVIPGNGYLVIGVNPEALANQLGITGALGPFTGSLN